MLSIYNSQTLQYFAEVLQAKYLKVTPCILIFDFLTTAELSKIDLHFSNLSNVRVTDSALCLMNVGWNDENLSLVARVGHAWGIFDKTPSNQNKVYELLIKRRFGT